MTTNNKLRDIPLWFSIAVPAAFVLMSLYGFFYSDEFAKFLVRRDEHPDGGGIAEHGTVLVLLFGISAGIAVLRHYRRELPLWFVGWLAGWVLACIYFAGEEASWGQHYFHWGTPDALRGLNDQNETNLHNTSTWFDQKPRTLVELWMIFAGFIMPILHRFRPRALWAGHPWARWFWPSGFAIPVVLAFLFAFVVSIAAKKTSSAELMRLGSNELREFYVAFFLSGYLMSLWLRIRAK
jgi:hypothetical protein